MGNTGKTAVAVKDIRRDLKALRQVAKLAMPEFVAEIDSALKALPKKAAALALVQKVRAGGSALVHYPALRALGSGPGEA